MRAVFVSDIHIGSPEDRRAVLFLGVLDSWLLNPPEKVFLLGDIFDLWIADRKYFVDRYARIIEKVHALVQAGVEVHYFEGNHDLDLVPFWQNHIGCTVHEGPYQLQMDRFTVIIEHGDQMDPSDKGYLFLRWLLRTPVLRWLGRHLPNSWVRRIGERASAASREYTSNVKTIKEDEVRTRIAAHVRKVRSEVNVDVHVSGHVHVRDDSEISCWGKGAIVRSLNLGSWLDQPVTLELVVNDGNLTWEWFEL